MHFNGFFKLTFGKICTRNFLSYFEARSQTKIYFHDFIKLALAKMSKPSQKSWVWNYFEKENKDSAKCNLCKKLIGRAGGKTSGMALHLKIHDIKERECTIPIVIVVARLAAFINDKHLFSF